MNKDAARASPQLASGGGPNIAKVLVRRGRRVLVTHLDLAAFLYLKKVYCADALQRSRKQFEIVFYDPHNRAEGLALDYINHTEVSARAYAGAIRDLKCLLHRFNNKT